MARLLKILGLALILYCVVSVVITQDQITHMVDATVGFWSKANVRLKAAQGELVVGALGLISVGIAATLDYIDDVITRMDMRRR
jgi:hypothetical protein